MARFGWPLRLVLASAIAILAMLGTASAVGAATSPFGCSASPARAVFSSPASTFEPTLAGGNPCVDGSHVTRHGQTNGGFQMGASAAFVHIQGQHDAPGAGSLASAISVQISSPNDQVVIATAQAEALYACAQGGVLSSSGSEVTGLKVDGQPVTLASGSQTAKVNFGNDGSYVVVNKVTATSTSLTRTAALIHLEGYGDFTIAEAVVTARPNPCGGTHGFVPAVSACPAGSVYDPVTQTCLITAFTVRPIFVSGPFNGPTGATVYALRHARSLVKGGRCLSGAGPRYAMVAGTSGLISGTSGGDRIVTLSGNFTIEGHGGKDCISTGQGTNVIRDGTASLRIYLGTGANTVRVGGGNDVIQGGAGRDNIQVGNGNDRITVRGPGINKVVAGNGNDYVQGGAGANRISVGNGNDTIIGGAGFDTISAGNGTDTITAGPGIDRITAGSGNDVIRSAVGFDRIQARGAGAQVRCADKAQVTLNPAAVPYARAHGCNNAHS